jgi:hypothetical protein
MSLEATMIMSVTFLFFLASNADSKLQCRQQRKQSQWRLHVSISNVAPLPSGDDV